MVTKKEFWYFSSAVADRVLEMADRKPALWSQVIPRFPHLPPPQRQDAFERLAELVGRTDVSAEVRSDAWSALDALVRHHRAFSKTDWALPADTLDQLSSIAERLAPEDPVQTHKWLFDEHFPDLESKTDDLSEQERRLNTARGAAVQQIAEREGLAGIVRLAEQAHYPWFVGTAVADAEVPIEDELMLAMLDESDRHKADFAFGFSARRARGLGWPWINPLLETFPDRPLLQSRLLRCSDDLPRVWERAKELGPEVDKAYWREFVPYGRGRNFNLVNEAAERLLAHGRPGAALDLLNLYADRTELPISAELIAQAFDELIGRPADDPEFQHVQTYEVEHLLAYLRSSELDEDRLALLEWRLLPAVSFDARTPTLERRLSRDPKFFVEVLSLCFKPRHGEQEREVPSHVAENAFRLLGEWKIVPGSIEREGEVDEDLLRGWVADARELLAMADRLEVGDVYIGEVFAHSKEDPDGTWPTLSIRNVIESVASTDIEDGLRTGIYNKRGVTSRGVTDGGKQEYELAEKFEGWASKVRDQWPRTGAVLRAVAEGYRAEGRRYDEEAERFRRSEL